MKKNVLVYSIPFGFGPTGKAIVIAKELAKAYSVTLITYQHSLQITEQIEDVEIVDCGTRDFSCWDKGIFEKVDILISIMDLKLLDFVSKNFPDIKTVFVDSLFWWRKSLSDLPFDSCSLFILQSYPGVAEKLKEVPDELRCKFYEVGPILSVDEFDSDKNGHLLLHFGGVSSLIAKWEWYLLYFEVITSVVIDYAVRYGLELEIAGNSDLMTHLKNRFGAKWGISFSCLNHHDFIKRLVNAGLFITTCGIEATYEAFEHHIPTIFLPPINSTQLYQLASLTNLRFPAITTTGLSDAFNNVIDAGLEYHLETLEIAKALEKVMQQDSERNEIAMRLENFAWEIINNLEYRTSLIEQQKLFCRRNPYSWIEVLTNELLLRNEKDSVA